MIYIQIFDSENKIRKKNRNTNDRNWDFNMLSGKDKKVLQIFVTEMIIPKIQKRTSKYLEEICNEEVQKMKNELFITKQ